MIFHCYLRMPEGTDIARSGKKNSNCDICPTQGTEQGFDPLKFDFFEQQL